MAEISTTIGAEIVKGLFALGVAGIGAFVGYSAGTKTADKEEATAAIKSYAVAQQQLESRPTNVAESERDEALQELVRLQSIYSNTRINSAVVPYDKSITKNKCVSLAMERLSKTKLKVYAHSDEDLSFMFKGNHVNIWCVDDPHVVFYVASGPNASDEARDFAGSIISSSVTAVESLE